MFLGLDVGTSGVKAVLVDESQQVLAQATAPLEVSRPHPGWSEQDPEDWWQACVRALSELARGGSVDLRQVQAIGLSGQMHGATLLDRQCRVLRPAILWNDGRSASQCATLENRLPSLARITGNLAMPGFTAPKLLWVAENEPEIFERTDKVLLPKDYIRYRLSGHLASDMSDAAESLDLSDGGTLILDNRSNSLSPILSLHENGEVKGTLELDVSNTKGYETDRFWEISRLKIRKGSDPVKLRFTAHWSYGKKLGAMEIDRESGANSFCLGW